MTIRKLSFVQYGEDDRVEDAWPKCNGGPAGRERAIELVRHLKDTGNYPLFIRTLKDAVKSETDGVDAAVTGFLFAIAGELEGK